MKKVARSCPKAVVADAVLEARTQLLPLKENVPEEFPAVKVFSRYWRKSTPVLKVWFPWMELTVAKSCPDCEGRRSAPVPVFPSVWNELVANVVMGSEG